jgi:hypothetical protein
VMPDALPPLPDVIGAYVEGQAAYNRGCEGIDYPPEWWPAAQRRSFEDGWWRQFTREWRE